MFDNLKVSIAYEMLFQEDSDNNVIDDLLNQASNEKSNDYYYVKALKDYFDKKYESSYDWLAIFKNKLKYDAFYLLGNLMEKGVRHRYPYESPQYYWKKGAEQNDIRCIRKLAFYYKDLKTPAGDRKFVDYYRKVVNMKSQNADAYGEDCYILASFFMDEKNKKCNYDYAFDLVERGFKAGCIKLAHLLSDMYFEGHGITRDANKALEILHQAASSGDSYSIEKLIRIYKEGFGRIKRNLTYVKYFGELGLREKNVYATLSLVEMYLGVLETEEDLKKARELLTIQLPKCNINSTDKEMIMNFINKYKNKCANESFWKNVLMTLEEFNIVDNEKPMVEA